MPSAALASKSILVVCDKSPAFTKLFNSNIKKLETRLAKYGAGTSPVLALQEQIS